ncbi:Uncharacterised protein (plasmid) [Tsukamurella tyrosinosolvens]|nr:hypothetical protein AXK58_14285 [Tsukamurella tyrosinosolvens]VEH93970.1 Uncharacterised protein [Tsukamurella tyrosinosolvens]
MPGRQLAWLLEATGAWLAIVEVDVESANGQSSITLQVLARREQLQLDTVTNRARSGPAELARRRGR